LFSIFSIWQKKLVEKIEKKNKNKNELETDLGDASAALP
jgi:hypothetical protein